MRRRRFGIFSRHELSSASFVLNEAITDELLRELLRSPDKDSAAMSEYLEENHVEKDTIEGIYQNIEISAPRLLTVLRACKGNMDPAEIAERNQVILPFVETCLELMDRQKDMEPKRSLKEGYYY